MKELEASLTRDGKASKLLDLGEWDISVGLEKTIYITNPNKYARADLKGIKNSDRRLSIDLPDEIGPDKTVPVRIRIAGREFDDPDAEELYFNDILDKLSGRVIWRTP